MHLNFSLTLSKSTVLTFCSKAGQMCPRIINEKIFKLKKAFIVARIAMR